MVDATLKIQELFSKEVVKQQPLNGFLTLCTLADSSNILIKQSKQALIEGKMITALSNYIATAELYYYDSAMLIMEYIDNDGIALNERMFAKSLATMHTVKFDVFGFDYDTTIGPYQQCNTKESSWVSFFKDQRLLFMGRQCMNEGMLPKPLFSRLEKFCDVLETYCDEPEHASLLHGDIWGGNVLSKRGEGVLIDPAIYYGAYEMEIAFTRLFHTFSKKFYEVYNHYLKLDKEFYTQRCDILNLYPLLVHVRSFGGSYVSSVDRTLKKFGY